MKNTRFHKYCAIGAYLNNIIPHDSVVDIDMLAESFHQVSKRRHYALTCKSQVFCLSLASKNEALTRQNPVIINLLLRKIKARSYRKKD